MKYLMTVMVASMLLFSVPSLADPGGEGSNTGCNGVGNVNSPCSPGGNGGGGEGNGGGGGAGGAGGNGTGVGVGVGVGVGIGVGIADAEANATATATSNNQNINTNNNTNQQQQGQVQGQQQGQTQTATGGNAVSSATGGSVNIAEGAVQNTNTNTATGGSVEIAEGAVQNSFSGTVNGTNTLNVAEGAVTAEGGAGGSVNIAEGAVDNTSSATASTGDVVVNNNFGGEDGNGTLASQTVEGSTQVVEGSTTETNVTVDASTDFRRAPVASVAPVFSSACSGGMSFQGRDLGMSVGDAEHYCKLLQLADVRFAQSQTIVLIPPTPPTVSDCTGNVPDYTKGSKADTELQKQATATCFRQNEAAMAEYAEVVDAYNAALVERTDLMNQAYALVDEAEQYVRRQQTVSNVAEISRKVAYPVLLIKGIALLFF